VVIRKTISVHTKCRKIWAWKLWNGGPSRRWAWLRFVFRVFRCAIFILVAVRVHYVFSYLILRKQTSPSTLHTRKLTLHWEKL